MVNEPSVFEPLKFYCSNKCYKLGTNKPSYILGVAREKCLENDFFSRSGNFVDGQGNRKDLESQGKVREFENR